MGLSPRQIDRLTPWEFDAAFRGWCQANGVKIKADRGEMSDERLQELGIKGFE